MRSKRSLGLFGNLILVHLYFLLLMQFGFQFKYRTIADDQLLLQDEVDTLNSVIETLGLEIGRSTIDTTFCNGTNSSSFYDSDLRIGCNCSFNNQKLCHIDKLDWSDKGLKGFLSEAVANLSYLEKLDLSSNEIQGNIPASLGNMSRLFYLDLSTNQLTGRIPIELGNLKARTPDLSNKESTGRIPNMPEYYAFGPLTRDKVPCRYSRNCHAKQNCPSFELDLSNNYLDGSIPESLGSITLDNHGKNFTPDLSCSDFSISLNDNHLTGSIPKSLGNLKYLTSLSLQRNLLSGPIHPSFGDMSSLRFLYLSENQLNGSLPPQLGKLTSLQYLMLQSNYFTGDFPSSFGQLAELYSFSISGNYLSGPFPDVITNWTLIEHLSLQGNNFWGSIPSKIFNFSSLNSLRISDVRTSSFKFPETIASPYINTLVLRNCSITDYIPKFINGTMSSLEYLDLSFNNLIGGIPDSLANINFIYMSLANNLLSGPIPDWISRAAARTKMDLSFNNFSDAGVELRKNPNVTLFSCCQSCNSTNCKPEMRNVDHLMMQSCPDGKPKHHSLYINCGGEQIDNMDGNNYYQDNLTSFSYGVSSKRYWAFTSSGSFLSRSTNSSDYIKKVKCGISVAEAPLYEKARLAPVSLKYYGYCLHNGTYNVTLHFAEIVYVEDEDKINNLYSLKKRIFDVYIQGKRVETDFNINRTAGGPNKIALIENHTTVVNNSQLEIHLYWAGKGSSSDSGDSPDFNGPLLSAISVTPGFTLGTKKLSRLHIALITIASIIFALLLLLAFAWIMGWLEKEELHDIQVSEEKNVTLNQLIAATRRFSKEMEIGQGGFGTVYKAELPDHHIVAVKKLSTLSDEGIDKLKNEIYNLQSLRHENLVRLFDIHIGKGLCFLVYEYMENRSLADVLFDPERKDKLEWETRFNICLGIAKGLEYLHERPRQKMVHRGIKAANILLDGTFKSKISDFGLASTYAESDNDATQLLKVMKTEASKGYMAPEYPVIGMESSYKYDVYGFGVVLLEIVCGKKNVSPSSRNNQELEILVDEVWKADRKGRLLDLLDKSLSTYETKQVIIVLKLAVKCTSISPGVRPTMSQVVSALMNEKTLEEISENADYVEWLEKEELHDIRVSEVKTVTLKQLIAATRRFSKEMEIGKGGFGTVYKAELPDHHIVAVKISTLPDEGIEKLKNEIYNLKSLRHDNLIRLYDILIGKGFCFFVYEYMENRSLADVLFDPERKVKLEWETRFNICLGIAKGLEYLHERPRQKMVHRGIKAANILLDGTFKSKISDFGLASTYAESDNDATQFLRVMKTEASKGYMAPEYPVIGNESSYKYDVYGFGVVLLEIVCGKKNVSPSRNNPDQLEILVDEVWIADTKGRLLDLLDKNLATYETKQVLIVLKLAVKCTSISPGVRPTMSQVVSVLMNEKTLEEISEPADSKEADILTQDSTEDLAKDAEYSSASA